MEAIEEAIDLRISLENRLETSLFRARDWRDPLILEKGQGYKIEICLSRAQKKN
jgi:hypothetical protein